MLDSDTRTAVLTLKKQGRGKKAIAHALGISVNSVRAVLKDGRKEVPESERPQQLLEHADLIRRLFNDCRGNLVRVHEELRAQDIPVPYSTLTGFCRRFEIGVKEKLPAGRYHFEPGAEMQHDTSPHDVTIAGKVRRVQCAALVLCYSRMVYAQVYPTFNRFYCKVFLTEALKYFQGAASVCMVDNTNVVIAHGTGRNAVVAPEMAAFGERFGFTFQAHEVGDANRSAHVERGFHHIENNFYPGRTFTSRGDLNAQLTRWCDKVNSQLKSHLKCRPLDLYQTERPHLKPLPLYIPEVYAVHIRVVNLEGYVSLHTNRYSVPARYIGQSMTLHEGKDTLRIYEGHTLVATHERQEDNAVAWVTQPEHRIDSRWRKAREVLSPIPEENTLKAASPVVKRFVEELRARESGRAIRPIRQLYRLYVDYPLPPLLAAIENALRYGLFDLNRIERMVLKNIAGDYFRLAIDIDGDNDEDTDE